MLVSIPVPIVIEVEHIEEITNGRAVHRYIRVVLFDAWIFQVVTAPAGQRFQMPVPFNELQD